MTVYQWKAGSRITADAQKVGEVCAKIEKKGELTPKALVDASRRKNAPLHNLFEWNDAVAAEKYRENQAAYLIRSVEVVISGCTEPTRAFVSVSASDTETARSYINVEAALSSEPTRSEVLENALAELRSFERKYANLTEVAEVIAAIKSILAA